MHHYPEVITRFLHDDERLILSIEKEMPLVIEANYQTSSEFLQNLLTSHSDQIIADLAQYGAVLLRGFDISTEEQFEKTVLSIQGLRGISDAFMSEEGRIQVGKQKYVLHTNAVYKTGGTLYLGGFHSENYYSSDVPSYISFCCFKPSLRGGETGLVNMEKLYRHLDNTLKEKLEKHTFFVAKWLISQVAKRYQISVETIEEICQHFNLPILGEGEDKSILMYKPSVFEHPITHKKALQINLFELPTLNKEIRKCFVNDYQGKHWFWHRLVWRLPNFILKLLEYSYMSVASFFYSPKNSLKLLRNKIQTYKKNKKNNLPEFYAPKVGSCFTENDIKTLAKLIRNYYSSCLWKKGDILLVDNKQVAHAGMPGAGPRTIRAMVCNPLAMNYSFTEPGTIDCTLRTTESIGYYMAAGKFTYKQTPFASSPINEMQENL